MGCWCWQCWQCFKLIETRNSSKHFIGYIDQSIRQLVLILPKMGRSVKTFFKKDGVKDKNKNKKLSYRR